MGKTGLLLFLEAYRYYYFGTYSKPFPTNLTEAATEAYAAYEAFGRIPDFFGRIPKLYAKESTIADAPSQGRHITQDESRLKEALLSAASSYTPDPITSREHDPEFWKIVFAEYFKKSPTGNGDPLWDTLFAAGMPLLRSLKTASS